MYKELNIKVSIYLILLYSLTAFICITAAYWANISLVFWMPAAIGVGFAIKYGKRSSFAILIGGTILILLSTFIHQYFYFNTIKILILTLSDALLCLGTSLFYKSKPPFLNYVTDFKKYAIFASLLALVESLFITVVFRLLVLENGLNIITSFNIKFIAISISLFTLTPFILTIKNKPANIEQKYFYRIIATIILALVPNIVNIINTSKSQNLLPFQLITITLLIIYAVKQRYRLATLFVLILSSSIVFNGILNKNYFSIYDFPYNIINSQYIALLISLFIIIVNVILNERDNAIKTINESYIDIQNEVNRQTGILKDLNQRLISEIEQRGLIEKELNLSKKLLLESQEIANITSWEYDLKNKTIRWSESASRILGINLTQISAFSMDKYIERIHPDDKRSFLGAISQASEKTKDINLEIKYLLNNRYRYFRILGRSFEDNDSIKRIVGVLSDITDWKEAQIALSEKEIRYRALFETNIDPVILIDGITKTIVDVNKAFENLYEYSKSEILGTPYINISAQEYETHQALDITLERGSYRVPSRSHRKKSGEEFYVEGHFVKFLLGTTPLIFAVLRDNTVRKNYESRLAERELKFRLFFESNLIGMAETTIYKDWITFNTKLCHILGYKPSELEKITWDKITYPEDLDFELKQFNNILQHKTDNYTIEKRFIKKDGSTVYCNVAVKAIKDNTGNITHLVKLIEDTTLKKKAETALIESQSRLQKAQQIAHLGVCRLNMASGYLDISPEAFVILGLEKEKAPFNMDSFINGIHPSDREQLNTIIERLKNNKTNEEIFEARFVKNSGDIAYLALNLGISSTNNKITDLIITFADITTSKLAETSLKEANAMKDQLFSVISHDLKGPIGSMEQLLSIYLNSNDTLNDESKNEIISLLYNTTHESYSLLENLLEWGRSQRQSTAKPSIIDIDDIVLETTSLLLGMASNKNIVIKTSITKGCKAFVDPMMFRTILRNLITNAIKFTPNGGNILIEGCIQNKNCTIKVTDSGTGIPDDKIAVLFDDSKIFSTAGTNNEKGSGLGLKLVKRFVDKNEGILNIQSSKDQGTTFIITFPSTEAT